MPDHLTQTALDFCRDCLGWEKAELQGDDAILRMGALGNLCYRDLNSVIAEAEEFSTRHGLFLSVTRAPSGGTWAASLFNTRFETTTGATCSTQGHAILSACVEAVRKFAGAA